MLCDVMNTVGDYQYNEKDVLGKGAFGTVYRGQSRKNLEVAIKRVTLKLNSSNLSSEWIEREMKILKALSDPAFMNIVTLLYLERKATDIYFVMEFCNGGNLQQYLQNKRKLDERTIRLFLRQIAAGLRVAHDMHIVHRDLKPENILLCFYGPKYPSPDNITIKIADFGIGRFLDEDELARTLCGTPLYTAQEILVGRPYDYKVDLWSVGVIAYECIVGSLPTNSLMACKDVVEIPTNISPDLAHLLNGLLDKDENKRFDIKRLFNHQFLAATISMYVVESGKDHTKMILVKDNQSIDHLIDIVCAKYSTDSEAASLFYEDGRPLERGSSNTLREFGIKHNHTVILGVRLDGGNDEDGKVAPDTSSTVSS